MDFRHPEPKKVWILAISRPEEYAFSLSPRTIRSSSPAPLFARTGAHRVSYTPRLVSPAGAGHLDRPRHARQPRRPRPAAGTSADRPALPRQPRLHASGSSDRRASGRRPHRPPPRAVTRHAAHRARSTHLGRPQCSGTPATHRREARTPRAHPPRPPHTLARTIPKYPPKPRLRLRFARSPACTPPAPPPPFPHDHRADLPSPRAPRGVP
jgi:hypothetical protein